MDNRKQTRISIALCPVDAQVVSTLYHFILSSLTCRTNAISRVTEAHQYFCTRVMVTSQHREHALHLLLEINAPEYATTRGEAITYFTTTIQDYRPQQQRSRCVVQLAGLDLYQSARTSSLHPFPINNRLVKTLLDTSCDKTIYQLSILLYRVTQ